MVSDSWFFSLGDFSVGMVFCRMVSDWKFRDGRFFLYVHRFLVALMVFGDSLVLIVVLPWFGMVDISPI